MKMKSLKKLDQGKAIAKRRFQALEIFDTDDDHGIPAAYAHPLRPFGPSTPDNLAEASLCVFELPWPVEGLECPGPPSAKGVRGHENLHLTSWSD